MADLFFNSVLWINFSWFFKERSFGLYIEGWFKENGKRLWEQDRLRFSHGWVVSDGQGIWAFRVSISSWLPSLIMNHFHFLILVCFNIGIQVSYNWVSLNLVYYEFLGAHITEGDARSEHLVVMRYSIAGIAIMNLRLSSFLLFLF